MGAQRLIDMMHDRDIFHVVEVFPLQQIDLAQQFLNMFGTLFREIDRARLFIFFVVAFQQIRH